MRTLLAGEGEGICAAVGEDAVECSGRTEGKGDSSLLGQGGGVDDSCAAAIASESDGNDPDDRRDDSQSMHSSASSRLERCCPAIRNRAGILHQSSWRQTDRAGD